MVSEIISDLLLPALFVCMVVVAHWMGEPEPDKTFEDIDNEINKK